MINKIKNILSNINDVSGWKIVEERITGREVFFIKKELDMNRGKKVNKYHITIYKDFEEAGKKFRGSSTTNLFPSMEENEIKDALQQAAIAAKYVRNEYYPLVKPCDKAPTIIKSRFEENDISNWLKSITDTVYEVDTFDKGWINSAELFLNKIETRIINSQGVDVTYTGYRGELEFITNWQESGEEVELYRKIDFADYKPELIQREVEKMLMMSRERAISQNTPTLEDINVILNGDPVKEFFKYYYFQTGAQFVYEQISTAKLDEKLQGQDVKGDTFEIKLDPQLNNSIESAPYDEDGFLLKPVELTKDGFLKQYWGNQRYSYYLDVQPTGKINNFVIKGGKENLHSLKKEPYLELLAFSDFQVDPLTGNFGGEIRLGRYFDGNNVTPVTGGSISGNVREVEKEMYLSKEDQINNNFVGPLAVLFYNVNISGN